MSIMGFMAATTRYGAVTAWTALLPLGVAALVCAIVALGSADSPGAYPDSAMGRYLFIVAVGLASAGIISAWLALEKYREPVPKVSGFLGGIGLLFGATFFFSAWYRGIASRSSA